MISVKNQNFLNGLHPDVRDKYRAWLLDCDNAGIVLNIYSGSRSISGQQVLYNNYISGFSNVPAARPGTSFHNYGLAVDVSIGTVGKDAADLDSFKQAAQIGEQQGIVWGGTFKSAKFKDSIERHHFQITLGYGWQKLSELYSSGAVDANGFVILKANNLQDAKQQASQPDGYKPTSLDTVKTSFGDDIGVPFMLQKKYLQTSPNNIVQENIKVAKNIITKPAVGIWQIVKLIVDKEVANKAVNDFTIAFNQGSLINFVNKVCMEPWVEFFSDTYGDKFYLIARKPPFVKNAWNDLYTIYIYEQDVISDSLSWYDGDVYSWYQLIPQGNYIGLENQVFQYIPAMYFQEYAEIWGSKPYSQITNYIEFSNAKEDKIIEQKAIDDLKFLVQINSYLPFTRKGTIVLNGDRRIRVGMKIKYNPTGEVFYVDAVNNSASFSEGGVERTTTLQVSRGLVEEYCLSDIEDSTSKNYFNLINFGEYKDVSETVVKKTNLNINFNFYFDYNKFTVINPLNTYNDLTIAEFDLANQNWRESKKVQNDLNEIKVIEALRTYPSLQIQLTGIMNYDEFSSPLLLSKQRAENLKNRFIVKYSTTYPEDIIGKNSLKSRITTLAITTSPSNKDTDVALALNRRVELISLDFTSEEQIVVNSTSNNLQWHVNREVLQFFINRKQLPDNKL